MQQKAFLITLGQNALVDQNVSPAEWVRAFLPGVQPRLSPGGKVNVFEVIYAQPSGGRYAHDYHPPEIDESDDFYCVGEVASSPLFELSFDTRREVAKKLAVSRADGGGKVVGRFEFTPDSRIMITKEAGKIVSRTDNLRLVSVHALESFAL